MGTEPSGDRVELSWLDDVWPHLSDSYTTLESIDGQHLRGQFISDRALDEKTETGQMLYVYAHNFLTIARANQQALHALLQAGSGPFAIWNLARPVFESSFYALFVLDSDVQRERLVRSLRIRSDNFRQHKVLMDAWEAIDPAAPESSRATRRADDERVTQLQAKEADRLHCSQKEMTESINITREVVRLSCLQDGEHDPRTFEVVWRQLSGIQHANLRALLAGGQLRRTGAIRGGHVAELSANEGNLTNVCSAALRLQLEAVQAYVRRTTNVT